MADKASPDDIMVRFSVREAQIVRHALAHCPRPKLDADEERRAHMEGLFAGEISKRRS